MLFKVSRLEEIIKRREDEVQRRYNTSKRARIRELLLENHERSNRKIADLAGSAHHLVAEIRLELEETGRISQFVDLGGSPRKDGTPAQPRSERDVGRKASKQERNAAIVRERDEERLDWGEIGQLHGIKAKTERHRTDRPAATHEPVRRVGRHDSLAVLLAELRDVLPGETGRAGNRRRPEHAFLLGGEPVRVGEGLADVSHELATGTVEVGAVFGELVEAFGWGHEPMITDLAN
jgi:hypothetical protein